MKKKGTDKPKKAAELRRRAEKRMASQDPKNAAVVTDPDTLRLLHELRVHQVELEMQNEELLRSRLEVEAGLERYTELYDFAPVGYFTLGPDGSIRQVNLSGATLLGRQRTELVGRRFGVFLSKADRSVLSAFLDRVFAGRPKESCEVVFLNEGTQPREVRIEAVASKDGRECRAAVMDITERKQMEDELRKARNELEQRVLERTADLKKANVELLHSNRELEQLAFILSHDLNEPLRMVASFVKLLEIQYKGKLDEQADQYIGYAVEGAIRMQKLIHEVLEFSHVQSRGRPFAPTDCEELLAKVCQNLKLRIEETRAHITHDPLPTVLGDETQLTQVFQNLIDNALKFQNEGEIPQVHVSADRKNDEWVFTVRDNGIGIAPEFCRKIFVIFQRLHARRHYPGTGIGLAIVKKIVERHGGDICAESKPGEGSTFYFTIPVNKEQHHAEPK